MEEYIVKAYLASAIILLVVISLFPLSCEALENKNRSFVLADTAGTGLVGSDIQTNTYLKAELLVYQANDADPNYDYYLVEFNMFDQKWQNDFFIDVVNTRIWIIATPSLFLLIALIHFTQVDLRT